MNIPPGESRQIRFDLPEGLRPIRYTPMGPRVRIGKYTFRQTCQIELIDALGQQVMGTFAFEYEERLTMRDRLRRLWLRVTGRYKESEHGPMLEVGFIGPDGGAGPGPGPGPRDTVH